MNKLFTFIALFAVLGAVVCQEKEVDASTIKLHVFERSTKWWIAVDPRDERYETVKVDMREAAASSWTETEHNPDWGYFHMASASGRGFTLPISFRLTASTGEQLIAVVYRFSAGAVIDTKLQYAAPDVPTEAPTESPTETPTDSPSTEAPTESPSTEAPTDAPTSTDAPTEAPSTEAPTDAPASTEAPATEAPTVSPSTEAPTEGPTQAPPTQVPTQPATQAPSTQAPTQPATQAPSTQAPSTQAPSTQAPTQPATQAPTQPATQAPTQPATQAPTQPATRPPTQAPTQPATQAPTQPATQAPTQPATRPPTQAPTVAPTAAATQRPTQPPTQAPTQLATRPPTQPATQSPVDLCATVSKKVEPIKILVPLYVYPGAAWDKLITAAQAGVKIIAIINPNSGPRPEPDANYVRYMKKFQDAGVEMVGYVHTEWGRRSITTVTNEISVYAAKYTGVTGIFFDEASTELKDVPYYRTAYDFVLSKGFVHSILNPGTQPVKQYLDISTNIVIFENYAYVLAGTRFDSWVKCAPNAAAKSGYQYKFSSIIHSATLNDMPWLVSQSHALGMGLVYITDGAGGCCTYNTLTSYFT